MVFVALLVVLAVCSAAAWLLVRRRPNVVREADQFAAARAMTKHWSENPGSAPKTLRTTADEE